MIDPWFQGLRRQAVSVLQINEDNMGAGFTVMLVSLQCSTGSIIKPYSARKSAFVWVEPYAQPYTNLPLSEEIAHPTVYHHLSQLSVYIQSVGLIKCRENPGVQMQLTWVISHSIGWISWFPIQ